MVVEVVGWAPPFFTLSLTAFLILRSLKWQTRYGYITLSLSLSLFISHAHADCISDSKMIEMANTLRIQCSHSQQNLPIFTTMVFIQ